MNINDLTLGEMAYAEDLAGMPLSALGDDNVPKTHLLIALVTVIKKRENPNYTAKDAERLTMTELGEILNFDDGKSEAGDDTPKS